MIRLVRPDELARLREIEVAAGRAFATIDMAAIADDDPPSIDHLEQYRQGGRAWVHTDRDDVALAYLIAEVVDAGAHIEQVSVDPVAAGSGLGRALIDHLAGWAADRGLARLTLTTFTNVPWNGPYYERLGFRRLTDDELTEGLRRIRAAEAAHGLDAWPRCAMARELVSTPEPQSTTSNSTPPSTAPLA